MTDVKNQYKINVKEFGYINWIGFWTLYKKEVLRFLIVMIQTINTVTVLKYLASQKEVKTIKESLCTSFTPVH